MIAKAFNHRHFHGTNYMSLTGTLVNMNKGYIEDKICCSPGPGI